MATSVSPIAKAVRYLQAGDWQAAHTIVQKDSSSLGCWAHGIVHLIEGDLANARYWYRRAHRVLPHGDTAAAEIAALKDTLQQDMPKQETAERPTPEKSTLKKGTQ
jgi:hypothetical protein